MSANPNHRRTHLSNAAVPALLALLVAGCGSTSTGSAGPADPAPAGATPGVLVVTMQPRRVPIAGTLTLYGEVAQEAGASENVTFARAVLLSHLRVSAGQRVRAGQPLLEVVTDPNAGATYQQAQSAVMLAQKELSSQQELFTERLTTQSQLAAAQKGLRDAKAQLAAEQQSGSAPGTEVVRAAHDAVVASVGAQQGDRVQAGTSVLQLSRSGAQRVLLGAEPEDAAQLSAGMPVDLTPVFGEGHVSATVSQVYEVINPQTRLVDVAVRLIGGTQSLLPGQKVRGEITLHTADAWIVPPSAVLTDTRGAYIYQVAKGRAHRVPVRVAVEKSKFDGLTGEIDPTSPIVVSGNYELEDGVPVRTGRQ